jgi:hypothetical protein
MTRLVLPAKQQLIYLSLNGQSHPILDYIFGSGKLKQYFLQDRLWFLTLFFYFVVPEIFKNRYLICFYKNIY